MNIWEWQIKQWRPVYALCLWYLRHSPFEVFKEYLRHGVVGHSPRFVQFTNKDGIIFDLDIHECVQKAIFCFHYFEPEDVAVFRKFIRPGCTVLDVGANIGQYALLAAKLMGDDGQVYAFEPSVDVRERLEKNIALNDFQHIEVLPCAVAATSGRMKFFAANEEGNQGVGSLLPAEQSRSQIRTATGIDVDVVSLDDFCAARKLLQVDFLKIDVEGYDLEVLKGAAKLMAANPDMVIMSEVEPINLAQFDLTAKDFYAEMKRHGFHPWYAKRGQLTRLTEESPPYHPNVYFLHESKG
ncbi:MAG: FkbM family methyltransferase [Ghiorsea sp.]|nr:FkbM family methyltransferase [Ghiorsea sp.]